MKNYDKIQNRKAAEYGRDNAGTNGKRDRESMDKLYPKDPDHLYSKMQIEFYSCSYEKKSVTLRFPIQRWELNHMSTVHGGIIASAIDTACGTAVRSVSGKTMIPTINLNINYLSPGTAGDALLVTARADRAGRRICNISAQCRSEKNRKADCYRLRQIL